MVLWRLIVRCAEMDSCRRRMLSGVMVASMTVKLGKASALVCSEDGLVEDGDDDT